MPLTKLQGRLCNLLQEGLPVCSRPFAEIAKILNTNEQEVLRQAGELKKDGVIRRICALINYRALGKVSTLVTAHVPEKNLQEVAGAVNSLDGVSHNYIRGNYYNLWFTLQAQTAEEIKLVLSEFSERFGIDFHSLPVKHFFKLDVRFDAEGRGQSFGDVAQIPNEDTIELNENQKVVMSKLQNELDVVAEPFGFLCGEQLGEEMVLEIIKELIGKGVIRRIAAVVNHRKLGFVANVLFACEVPQPRIIEVGKRLACLPMVSHCYERQVFEGWPYNLFAMMHSQSMDDIRDAVNEFVEAESAGSFEFLPTVAELKKQPVKHHF